MNHGLTLITTLLLAASLAHPPAEPNAPLTSPPKPAGLTRGPKATVLRDGQPYRGIGVNDFDCFLRTLNKGDDTSYEAGLATLGAKGIPFARFCATGFWPRDMRLYHLILTGDSFPRASAWHHEHQNKWTHDTPEQFGEMLTLANPDPISAISLHAYEATGQRFASAMEVSRKLDKPVFIGEFGAPGQTTEQAAKCRRLLQAIVDHDIPLAALWVFDLKSPDGIVEATETTDPDRFLIGVQWYPEKLFQKDSRQRKLFKAFIEAASLIPPR